MEAGLGLIDTAHGYSNGDSERAIGEALSPKPEGLVVATKGGYSGIASREELRAQIEQSLESLRTDVIDLYYLHRVHPETPLEESLGVIAEYRDAGKIDEVGISAVSVDQVEAARRIVPIAAVQNAYNLADRTYDDVVDYCEENGIVFVPYYPLKFDGPPALERGGEEPRRHTRADRPRVAAASLAGHAADSRHDLDRAPAGKSRRARRWAHGRGIRGAGLTTEGRVGPSGVRRVQCDGGANERLQRPFIDRVPLVQIDGAPGVAFETGVEEA